MQPAAPVIERRAEWGRPSGQERGGRPTSFLGDGPHASPSRTDGKATRPELPAVAASLSSLRGTRHPDTAGASRRPCHRDTPLCSAPPPTVASPAPALGTTSTVAKRRLVP